MSVLVVAALREAAAGCTGLPAAHLARCAFLASQLPHGRGVLAHDLAFHAARLERQRGREGVAAAYRGALAAVDGYRAPAGAEV